MGMTIVSVGCDRPEAPVEDLGTLHDDLPKVPGADRPYHRPELSGVPDEGEVAPETEPAQ